MEQKSRNKRKRPTLHDIPGVPQRKMSETLLEFAKPLIDLLEGEASAAEMKKMIMMAVTVWNSAVLKEWSGEDRYLEMAHGLLSQADSHGPRMMFDSMYERKRQYFSDDLRAVGDFEITTDLDGRFRLHAEARLPETLLKTQ